MDSASITCADMHTENVDSVWTAMGIEIARCSHLLCKKPVPPHCYHPCMGEVIEKRVFKKALSAREAAKKTEAEIQEKKEKFAKKQQAIANTYKPEAETPAKRKRAVKKTAERIKTPRKKKSVEAMPAHAAEDIAVSETTEEPNVSDARNVQEAFQDEMLDIRPDPLPANEADAVIPRIAYVFADIESPDAYDNLRDWYHDRQALEGILKLFDDTLHALQDKEFVTRNRRYLEMLLVSAKGAEISCDKIKKAAYLHSTQIMANPSLMQRLIFKKSHREEVQNEQAFAGKCEDIRLHIVEMIDTLNQRLGHSQH